MVDDHRLREKPRTKKMEKEDLRRRQKKDG